MQDPSIDPAEDPASGSTIRSILHVLTHNIHNRVLAGVLLVAPFLVTFWIVAWLYRTLARFLVAPAAKLVVRIAGGHEDVVLPDWFVVYIAPIIGVISVGVLLYFLGFFAQSRISRIIDAVLLRVPIITTIHRAVRRVFQSLHGPAAVSRFQRAVLVEFPHPGIRVPGFVTSSCRDEATGKRILCIYVPTTPVPTSGFMLLIPEEDVTDLNWELEETIQAVISFGITAPPELQYYPRTTNRSDSQGGDRSGSSE